MDPKGSVASDGSFFLGDLEPACRDGRSDTGAGDGSADLADQAEPFRRCDEAASDFLPWSSGFGLRYLVRSGRTQDWCVIAETR